MMIRTRWPAPARRRVVGVGGSLIAIAMLFSGCAAGPAADAPRTSSATKELQSLTQAHLASTLAASVKENLVPGAIAVVTTPDGTVSASYGTTTLGETRAPQASDVFRIGSVTKTMVAAVILQLVREEELALADPIARLVAGVPNGQNITIADLLQMRSGLQNYLDTDGFATVFDHDMTTVWTPQQLVDFGFGYPAVSAPDTLHTLWLDDVKPMDPANPDNGPQYGLGIEQARFGPNRLYFHEGQLPGFNTFVATDPAHDVRFVIWTNLGVSPDGQATAKAVASAVIDKLYRTKLGTPVVPATGAGTS